MQRNMKKCLKCNQVYADDSLNYCLNDGTTLVFEGEQQTVVVQKTPPPKKSKVLLWLGLIGLIVFAGIGIIAALLIYNYTKPSGNLRTERQNKANLSPSPTEISTPRIMRTPPPSDETSPKPSPTSDDTVVEITPIAWTTAAVGFKGEDGQTYKFECPPDGTAGIIWGSDVYTADSSICTAAVHAGLITLEDGGIVTIEYRPGRQTYGTTTRNGITSNTYGEYSRSFVVR